MTKIILDCDPGIDDALALLFALAAPELDILAVTTVTGNRPVTRTFENARRLCALAGRRDVRVFKGAATPIAGGAPRTNLVHGEDGLGGAVVPSSGAAPETAGAAETLIEILDAHPPGSVTLVAIGPLTNLARALAIAPDIFRRAAGLAVMGGAVKVAGNVTPAAEFNFWADPVAAHRVLQSGVPVELFGLDVTSQAVCTEEWLSAVCSLPGPVGPPLGKMMEDYFGADPLLHDVCPVAWLIAPELFSSAPMQLRVETAGEQEGQSIEERIDASHPLGPGSVNVHVGVRRDPLLGLVLKRLRLLAEGCAQ